jgi:hypothetical protein
VNKHQIKPATVERAKVHHKYVLLGVEQMLLKLIADEESTSKIADLVQSL